MLQSPVISVATSYSPCQGKVLAIRGSVVDVHFSDEVPPLRHLLRAGPQAQIAIEGLTYLSANLIRGIALTPTQGLARGTRVIDTGQPLQVPVGEHLLGRVFNVFGDPIDGLGPLQGMKRSLHAQTVSLHQRTTGTNILVTGIKAIDLLAPLERGRF